MPKISFAAHISAREAIERRSKEPLPPGRGQNRRDPIFHEMATRTP